MKIPFMKQLFYSARTGLIISVITTVSNAIFIGCESPLDVKTPSEHNDSQHNRSPNVIPSTSNDGYLSVIADTNEHYFRNYKRERITPNELSKTLQGTYSNCTDASGSIHIGIWRAQGDGQHTIVDCDIDPDYVLVGGGVELDYAGGWGALITASYPLSEHLTTWEGRSKDHYRVNYHTIYVYAIGMKLDGVDRNTLFNQMILTYHNSNTTSHPGAGCNVPSGYKLIGGGAFAHFNGFGQCLVTTYASSEYAWYAASKDHIVVDKGSVTVYAIGINPNIPGFGNILFQRLSSSTYAQSSVGIANQGMSSGWVLTCPGAKAAYNGMGRMLFQVSPGPYYYANQVIAKSKDHAFSDAGNTSAYAIMIRKE